MPIVETLEMCKQQQFAKFSDDVWDRKRSLAKKRLWLLLGSFLENDVGAW